MQPSYAEHVFASEPIVRGPSDSEGFVVRGVDAGDESGISVGSAGDVNGDGVDDLIIGARDADPNGQGEAGESYVVFGRATGFPAAFEPRSLFLESGGDGEQGLRTEGDRCDQLVGLLGPQCGRCERRRYR
jgi:hypothetical protein